ncbi:hypothetical protein NDI45_30330, partial [Leptolyngbya sp. GB1-A1]|uniref:hypothetical protein n=1 Tax=Leptolyngbya sp. GB1-A1 TaxID=2933908 RepID=UPI003299D11C
ADSFEWLDSAFEHRVCSYLYANNFSPNPALSFLAGLISVRTANKEGNKITSAKFVNDSLSKPMIHPRVTSMGTVNLTKKT